MKDPDPKIEPRPGVGQGFAMRRFAHPSKDGVARGCQLTGRSDFPGGGFECAVEQGLQKVRILAAAPTNGDAGIARHVAVQPGDVYRLTARLRVVSKTGKFRARVNLAARGRDGSQVAEFNAPQEEVTDTAVERIVEATIPPGTDYVSARVKFHTSAPGEAGVGEILAMELERIPEPSRVPEGTRLSLYNFNIHKMDDDWRGWIKFIEDQKLAPPDVVLLQDIEHDADRRKFQEALAEAFGGRWSGVGSDPAWQVAVVWRSRRFSKMQSRIWRGFGGSSCVDDSQDAPALQVKLHHDAAHKWLSLVSLKTPPKVRDDCVWSNIRKVNDRFAPPWSGDLCIIGTDANSPDRDPKGQPLEWYARTVRSDKAKLTGRGSLGYCDPVADTCATDPEKLKEHATLGRSRIDFLLLKAARGTAPRVVRQMTLPKGNAAGVKWSDHRSVHAEVVY